jgi:hypothetical protein
MAEVTEVTFYVTYDGTRFNDERTANAYELDTLWNLYGTKITLDIIKKVTKELATKENKTLLSLAFGSEDELLRSGYTPLTLLRELFTENKNIDIIKRILSDIEKTKSDLKALLSYHTLK